MGKIEFALYFTMLIGSAIIYSERFAGRMNVNKKIYTAYATAITVFSTLSIATYVNFIYYNKFDLWGFSLTVFSVIAITIGISAIMAIFKIHRDDRKEYRELEKLTRETEKFIRDMKRNGNGCIKADECMTIKGGYVQRNDTYTIKGNVATKSNCCERIGGKTISFNEKRRKRR